MKQSNQTILIIDDSPMICKVVETAFADEPIEVVSAFTAEAATLLLRHKEFDLILLDVVLPDTNGYDYCQNLKQQEHTKDIPVLFLTSKTDVKGIERGFSSGGSDYIGKPFGTIELKARVKAHLQIKKNNDLLKQMNLFLQESLKENQRIAITDPLTGLFNRNYFNKQLQSQIKLSQAQQVPLSLLFCDLDDFKTINDVYGHSTGDYVLARVAQAMNEIVPANAKISRWGGEEFAILLSNTTLNEAYAIAEEVRKEIYSHHFINQDPTQKLTITIAAIEYNNSYSIDENMNLVDHALYQGKENGKNCCVKTRFNLSIPQSTPYKN